MASTSDGRIKGFDLSEGGSMIRDVQSAHRSLIYGISQTDN